MVRKTPRSRFPRTHERRPRKIHEAPTKIKRLTNASSASGRTWETTLASGPLPCAARKIPAIAASVDTIIRAAPVRHPDQTAITMPKRTTASAATVRLTLPQPHAPAFCISSQRLW